MSRKPHSKRVRQIYRFIETHQDVQSVQVMCRVLGVARLMRENNPHALHGYRTKRIAASKPAVLIPNLLQRQFTVTRPNTA